MSIDHKEFRDYINKNDINKIKELLLNYDLIEHNNWVLSYASANNRIEIVKLFLNSEKINYDNWAVVWAVRNNNMEVVKLLLQDTRIHMNYIKSLSINEEDNINKIIKLNRELKLKKLI